MAQYFEPRTTINREELLQYLQSQLTDFEDERKKYGSYDRVVKRKLQAMIACKDMVEALLQEPVNLGKDGKVTVGF